MFVGDYRIDKFPQLFWLIFILVDGRIIIRFLDRVFTRVSLLEYVLKKLILRASPFKKWVQYSFCFCLIEFKIPLVNQGLR